MTKARRARHALVLCVAAATLLGVVQRRLVRVRGNRWLERQRRRHGVGRLGRRPRERRIVGLGRRIGQRKRRVDDRHGWRSGGATGAGGSGGTAGSAWQRQWRQRRRHRVRGSDGHRRQRRIDRCRRHGRRLGRARAAATRHGRRRGRDDLQQHPGAGPQRPARRQLRQRLEVQPRRRHQRAGHDLQRRVVDARSICRTTGASRWRSTRARPAAPATASSTAGSAGTARRSRSIRRRAASAS